MPGKYVPPHLREGYVPPAPVPAAVKPRGVHFRSNATGMRTHNEHWHTYNKSEPPAMKLSRRVLRKTTRKSALKGKRQPKRQTRSNSPRRKAIVATRRRSV